MKKENDKKENDKKAVDYVQRLVEGRIPQCDVTFNYLSSAYMKAE